MLLFQRNGRGQSSLLKVISTMSTRNHGAIHIAYWLGRQCITFLSTSRQRNGSARFAKATRNVLRRSANRSLRGSNPQSLRDATQARNPSASYPTSRFNYTRSIRLIRKPITVTSRAEHDEARDNVFRASRSGFDAYACQFRLPS